MGELVRGNCPGNKSRGGSCAGGDVRIPFLNRPFYTQRIK